MRITISGSVVAAYPAVLSTITGAAQLWNYTRDRARIRVTAQNNMVMFGDARLKHDQTLWVVTVADLGRRPVTITTIGGYREYPLDPFVVVHSRPNLPHELTEGKHLIAAMPLDEMDVSKVLWWSASDAVGNQYYSKGGSWYARRKYWRNWKKAGEKEGLVLIRIELIRIGHRNTTGVNVCSVLMLSPCSAKTSGNRL